MSNRIKLQIEGPEEEDGDVRVEVFAKVLEAFKRALTETDRLVSGGRSLYFRVSGLSHSSPATIELEAVPANQRDRNRGLDFGAQVNEQLFENLSTIQSRKSLPRYADYGSLNAYKELASFYGKGVEAMSLFVDGERIALHPDFSVSVDAILGPDQNRIGSVRGYLHHVSLHNQNVFRIYPTVPGLPSLKCTFPNSLRLRVVDAVDRYVEVSGIKRFKALSAHPYEMRVTKIEIFPNKSELPTLASLRGIADGATGEVASEDYVRSVRDGWG
jgi:hypothetical protein